MFSFSWKIHWSNDPLLMKSYTREIFGISMHKILQVWLDSHGECFQWIQPLPGMIYSPVQDHQDILLQSLSRFQESPSYTGPKPPSLLMVLGVWIIIPGWGWIHWKYSPCQCSQTYRILCMEITKIYCVRFHEQRIIRSMDFHGKRDMY